MKKLLLLGIVCLITGSFAQAPEIAILQLRAPESFKTSFKTSKGEFIVETYRKWSHMGADRFYQLIKTGFFNNALFFRVELNYVVQFGVSASYSANRFWDARKMPDEPAVTQNKKGIISFARGGRNNRATQLFINMVDNPKLDTLVRNGVKGYTPVARVLKGMEVITMLNGRYGKKPATVQDSLYKYGNPYFENLFPGLDRIISATLLIK